MQALSSLALAAAAHFTKLRESKNQLQAELILYKELLDLSPCPTVLTDAHGLVVYVNKSYCTMLGVSLEDVRAEGWVRAIAEEDRERVVALWQEVVQQRKVDFKDTTLFKTVACVVRLMWHARMLPTQGYAAVIFHPGCPLHESLPPCTLITGA